MEMATVMMGTGKTKMEICFHELIQYCSYRAFPCFWDIGEETLGFSALHQSKSKLERVTVPEVCGVIVLDAVIYDSHSYSLYLSKCFDNAPLGTGTLQM